MNNRNSAYIRAGLALRLSLTLRLHRKPPENCSPRDREHRIRVWWTVYILDRISSSKVGLPVTVRDEDIDVQLPSLDGLTDFDIEDFHGCDLFNAQLILARITGGLLSTIYRTTRLDRANDFLQKVKKVLSDLTTWRNNLSPVLEFNSDTTTPYSSRSVASLHLNFTQVCFVNSTSITTKDALRSVANLYLVCHTNDEVDFLLCLRIQIRTNSPKRGSPRDTPSREQRLQNPCPS